MRLYAVLPAVIALLQREGRVTYRALQRDFGFDVSLLDDVRHELVFKRLAMDEQGQGLVWTGGVYTPIPLSTPSVPESQVQRSPAVPALPPMELASDTPPAVSSTASDVATTPPGVAPTKMTSPEQTATAPMPMSPDGPASGASPSITTEVQSTLADATEVKSSSHGAVLAALSTRSAPEAERRQLTVMFCDLVGSTDLSGKLDPEDLREVVRAYQETAAKVIQRYEGHIAQYLGDGLLIYFGFPVAHEDDARRAVYTGLGIPEALSTLNIRLEAEHGVQLAVRIGIHTGPVVVGEMGGSGRRENLALGETPNIAARLEGLAQANTTVISPVTAQLVQRSFVLEELGLHELKGVAEPMMLYTVIGSRETESDDHSDMLSRGFNALVGRDEEIGLLLRRWEQSKQGQGQVVLISGEAGIGKSSLVEGLRSQARQEGMTRIAFRCSPYHTNSALYPIIDHMARVLDWRPDDSAHTKLSKLELVLGQTRLAQEESVPLIASLLSLELPEGRYPDLELSPQEQRQQTLDVLVAWQLEEAERQPLLAVWEDLHWADPSTLEALGLLLDQTPTAAMLNLLTFRPEFDPPWPPRSYLTPITLNPLERPQAEALLTQLVGGKALPAEVVQHIVSKTDGVPLYVEELTKMLLDSDLIREEADHYVMTGPLLSVAIPDTLQDSLMARLDQLNTAKNVAQIGAVLGREFSYEMLQGITSQNEETLLTSLAQLVEAELLYQRGRPPRAKYIFKHALIQDAAYGSLLKSTRQRVHHQIAQLFKAHFPELLETQPELMAYHCTEAGQDETAIPYWQRAGQHAIQRSAYVEAIAHLTQGLALLTTLPATPARLQQELDLQVMLGPALCAAKGQAAPDVERAYVRARELCEQLGNTSQRFPVLRGLMLYYMTGGQTQTAYGLGEQLIDLAYGQSDPTLRMLAHYMQGQVLFFRGEPASAQTHHAQALAIYNPQEHQILALRYGIDLGVASGSFLSWELWQQGYPDQAMYHIQAARTRAQEASLSYSLVQALALAAVLHQWRRETLATQEQAEATRTLAIEQGFALWLTWGTVLCSWALAMQGQSEAPIAEIRQGIAAELATGSKLFQTYFLGLLAEMYGECGRPEEGLNALTEAMAVMDDTELRFYGAELYRLKGALLLRQAVSNASQAEACFHEALTIARHQQAKSWELRAASSLARLWQSQGKCQEAYDLLAPVYEWFTEGFDTVDLKEAQAMLGELSQ